MKQHWLFPFLVVLTIGIGCQNLKILKVPTLNQESFSKPPKMETVSMPVANLVKKTVKADPLYLANEANKYQGSILTNGTGEKREVALTFDDAPDDRFTPKILDILKSKGVKATFFVVGIRVKANPKIIKRIVKGGHILGNHSYNHAKLTNLDSAAFHEQINKTDTLIKRYTGFTPTFVRPPYGVVTKKQILWLASQHKTIVNWSVDSLDWKGLKAEQVEANVLNHVHPGSIILQHSGTGKGGDLSGTVQALPEIIDELRSEGYRFVTLPELLGRPAK